MRIKFLNISLLQSCSHARWPIGLEMSYFAATCQKHHSFYRFSKLQASQMGREHALQCLLITLSPSNGVLVNLQQYMSVCQVLNTSFCLHVINSFESSWPNLISVTIIINPYFFQNSVYSNGSSYLEGPGNEQINVNNFLHW
jgi:hypothetical protein